MSTTKKLTHEEFVLRAIEKLSSPTRRTVHTVYSGFNDAFRSYFPGADPIKVVDELKKAGKLSFRFCRGGAIIAAPGVISDNADPDAALKKMGL